MEDQQASAKESSHTRELTGNLHKNVLHVPDAIQNAPGIRLKGKLLKSFVFTTDVAIAHNCNADAVLAVYPFTPLRVISQAVILSANKPVLCGVGGGVTAGDRAIDVAVDAELNGASGVVLNHPSSNALIEAMKKRVDIPVLVTVISTQANIRERIQAGADILNVTGGAGTAELVRWIRDTHPDIPILATGGKTDDSIRAVLHSGANAITYTPPSCSELFRKLMDGYRQAETVVDNPARFSSEWWSKLAGRLRHGAL